ncbi:uncharacterized protein PF11_0213-like [Bombus bifarius]|uniref:Uncharacterized protein PF11_0213-like n=1 Tax=Bombus bifarius TaxID=103933 RepID=A0A6P8M9W0_9HYME|nr:uncharacterized protein PF11_0213-like [Bombus bifarius]
MCDLIDLDSPDRKGSLSSRLASPLIPAPADIICNNYNTRMNETSSLMIGKRDSLENNPFDMVLHKTTEYIQKKDDPFEITLEKALKVKCKKNTYLRSGSFDLPDSRVSKKKNRQKLKLNKTLDEFLINDKLNLGNAEANKITSKSIIVNSGNTNILSNNFKSDNVIPTINVQDLDLSILNQSVMNDILFEENSESNKNEIKSTLQKEMLVPNATLKIAKSRRSFSQGGTSPKRSECLHQISLSASLRTNSNSASNISSLNSLDMLNEGFLKSDSRSSISSNLSNISSIPKLNSVSSNISSSLMLSNGTMNRTFLESCSSERSGNTKLTEGEDHNKERESALSPTKNLEISVANVSTRSSLSDLTDRFNKLKARLSGIHIPQNCTSNKDELTYNSPSDIKECTTVTEKNEMCDINNKLIDVDVFTPDSNCSNEHHKSTISDTSSDSVFLEGNKINKSILQEAKLLAKTFEELAIKTSSGSSIDDLITSNPSWTLELLPAFDDETSENLIELPVSPDGAGSKSKNIKITENKDNESYKDRKDEFSNKIKKDMEDLEMELVEPISMEKRTTAVTLLLDLKKLIRTEKNIEANKLLENLEKVLGINCENNTELLTTYFNTTNNLSKSPPKSSSNLEVIKNVAENNMEYSKEGNLTGDSTESIKESVFFEDINVNNVNTSKCIDNQKYLSNINKKQKCETSGIEINIENINKEKDKNEFSAQKISENDSSCKEKNNSPLNEKVVIELLANIGKLICRQTEEHPTLNILKNLEKVLNVASNNCNVDKDTKNKNDYIEIQQTPKKSKLKSENEKQSSFLSKSVNRLSLNLGSKKQTISKNFIRRSVSVSQTPPVETQSGSLISTNKDTSQLKEVTKRFPSDPGFVSPVLNKKVIINNNKNQLPRDTQTKTGAILDLQKEKTSMICTVKNRLKKKIDIDIINKKGPMKAILPIGNMQKRENINKKITSSIGSTTPPHKIISSTPNSTTNGPQPVKKSRSSKPVASSTPDTEHSKTRKVQSHIANSPKKRNFSCDISPVTTRVNVSNNSGLNNSPRRSNKLPSPKKTTPKRRPTESGIPKAQTPPIRKQLHSSFEVKNGNNIQRSPLRDSNKLIHKVKPTNLISKLQRHSFTSTNVMDKENSYI